MWGEAEIITCGIGQSSSAETASNWGCLRIHFLISEMGKMLTGAKRRLMPARKDLGLKRCWFPFVK